VRQDDHRAHQGQQPAVTDGATNLPGNRDPGTKTRPSFCRLPVESWRIGRSLLLASASPRSERLAALPGGASLSPLNFVSSSAPRCPPCSPGGEGDNRASRNAVDAPAWLATARDLNRRQLAPSSPHGSRRQPRFPTVDEPSCQICLTSACCQATFPLSSRLDSGGDDDAKAIRVVRVGNGCAGRGSCRLWDRPGDLGAQLGADLDGRLDSGGARRVARDASDARRMLAPISSAIGRVGAAVADAQLGPGAKGRTGSLPGTVGVGDGRVAPDDQLDRAGALHAVAASRAGAGAVLRDHGGGDVRCA